MSFGRYVGALGRMGANQQKLVASFFSHSLLGILSFPMISTGTFCTVNLTYQSNLKNQGPVPRSLLCLRNS